MTDIEHRSAVSGISSEQQLDELLQLVNPLSIDAKAALVKHLLGTSDLEVGFERHHHSSFIAHISTMEQAALGDVLEAIALRVQGR